MLVLHSTHTHAPSSSIIFPVWNITFYTNTIKWYSSSKAIIKHNIAIVAIQRAVSGVAKQFTCMNGEGYPRDLLAKRGVAALDVSPFQLKWRNMSWGIPVSVYITLTYAPRDRRRRRYSKIMCDSANKFIETRDSKTNSCIDNEGAKYASLFIVRSLWHVFKVNRNALNIFLMYTIVTALTQRNSKVLLASALESCLCTISVLIKGSLVIARGNESIP